MRRATALREDSDQVANFSSPVRAPSETEGHRDVVVPASGHTTITVQALPATVPETPSGAAGHRQQDCTPAADGAPGLFVGAWSEAQDAALLQFYFGGFSWQVIASRLQRSKEVLESRCGYLRALQNLPPRAGRIPVGDGFPRTEEEFTAALAAIGGYQDVPHRPFNMIAALLNTRRLEGARALPMSPNESAAAICARGGAAG